MSNIWKVIEKKRWVNKSTGQTASIYGSVPYTNETEAANWFIEVSGYTLKNTLHNTIGAACVPSSGIPTLQQAEALAERLNNLTRGD